MQPNVSVVEHPIEAGSTWTHVDSGRHFRVLLPNVPGKDSKSGWLDGLVYVGLEDAEPRWEARAYWRLSFRPRGR